MAASELGVHGATTDCVRHSKKRHQVQKSGCVTQIASPWIVR